MATSKANRKNSDLRRAVRRGISKGVLIYLIIGSVCVLTAWRYDSTKGDNREGRKVVKELSEEKSSFYVSISEKKDILLHDLDKYCELVLTLNTISAAAVIFFYSVQDSRRGGIPHRTILAYTFGSFTIPILFVVTLIMLPIYYIADSFGWNWTVCVSLIFTYIMQMMIMIFILMSTSYQFSVKAITKVEIRQFQLLNELEQQKEQRKLEADSVTSKVKAERNPFFAWTYLQHHLEQATVSDELVVDKLLISRNILRVPYCQKRIIMPVRIKMSVKMIQSNNLNKLYEFYYENILAVFKHIDQPKNLEYRNELYLILYEFLEELTELYERYKSQPESERELKPGENNYIVTIAGIINAVLYSNVDEAEAFCNYVFNNVISRDMWSVQIGLYILFQEYLYRTNNSEAIKLRNIKDIEGIGIWKNKMTEDCEIYKLLWDIWMGYTTVLPNISCRYYYEAIRAFTGKGNMASPVAYAMHVW